MPCTNSSFLIRSGMESNGSANRGPKTEALLSGLALDQSSSSGRSTPTDLPHNKLFVGGLSWQTSAEKLREYFGQYGTIIDVQVLKDPLTQVNYSVLWRHFHAPRTRFPKPVKTPKIR